jgi:hypothetical protein
MFYEPTGKNGKLTRGGNPKGLQHFCKAIQGIQWQKPEDRETSPDRSQKAAILQVRPGAERETGLQGDQNKKGGKRL